MHRCDSTCHTAQDGEEKTEQVERSAGNADTDTRVSCVLAEGHAGDLRRKQRSVRILSCAFFYMEDRNQNEERRST